MGMRTWEGPFRNREKKVRSPWELRGGGNISFRVGPVVPEACFKEGVRMSTRNIILAREAVGISSRNILASGTGCLHPRVSTN